MKFSEAKAEALAQLVDLQSNTDGPTQGRLVQDRHGQWLLIATRGTKLQSSPSLGDLLLTDCIYSHAVLGGLLLDRPAKITFSHGQASMSVETGEWLFLGDDENTHDTAAAAYAALEAGRK